MLNVAGTEGPAAINNIYDERDPSTFRGEMNSSYVRTFQTGNRDVFLSFRQRTNGTLEHGMSTLDIYPAKSILRRSRYATVFAIEQM